MERPSLNAIRDFVSNDLGEPEMAERLIFDNQAYWNFAGLEDTDAIFCREIEREGQFDIVRVGNDGTTFLKALALILYGSKQYYLMVHNQILDYLMANKERFRTSVSKNFEQFVAEKRRRAPYACAVQVQAAAELYNRPIVVKRYNDLHKFMFNAPILKQLVIECTPRNEVKIPIPIMREDIISMTSDPIYMAYHVFMRYSALIPKQPDNENETPRFMRSMEESQRGP